MHTPSCMQNCSASGFTHVRHSRAMRNTVAMHLLHGMEWRVEIIWRCIVDDDWSSIVQMDRSHPASTTLCYWQ